MSDTERIVQKIDTSRRDRAAVKKFQDAIVMLSGLVIETLEKNPAMILSPLNREMLVRHAKYVKRFNSCLTNHVYLDNPSNEDFIEDAAKADPYSGRVE